MTKINKLITLTLRQQDSCERLGIEYKAGVTTMEELRLFILHNLNMNILIDKNINSTDWVVSNSHVGSISWWSDGGFRTYDSALESAIDKVFSKTLYLPLKSCPFCGSPSYVGDSLLPTPGLDTYDIFCSNTKCYLADGSGRTEEDKGSLVTGWNNRQRYTCE